MTLLDHMGKPILPDLQKRMNEMTRKMLERSADNMLKSFAEPPNNPYTESLGPVGDLRESCGLPRMKGGSGTIKFKRYEALKEDTCPTDPK